MKIKLISIVLILTGIILGWTNPSVSPLFIEKLFRFSSLIPAVIFLLSRRKIFYHLALIPVLLYPLFIFLSPSYNTLVHSELDKLLAMQQFLTSEVYESNMVNLGIEKGDILYFVSFGYYLSGLGLLTGMRDIRSLKFILKFSTLPVVLLLVTWLCLHISTDLMDRDYAIGRGIYSFIERINSFSGVIERYGYIYFKAGEFDARHSEETWEKRFYLALIHKNEGDFQQSLDLYKNIRPGREDLINVQLSDLYLKILHSKLSASEKIYLFKDIGALYQTSDLQIYLACLYLGDRSYNNAISLIEDVAPVISNKYILADLYNLLGDIYSSINEVNLSRLYYRKSLKMYDRVKNGNSHAYKGLAGW